MKNNNVKQNDDIKKGIVQDVINDKTEKTGTEDIAEEVVNQDINESAPQDVNVIIEPEKEKQKRVGNITVEKKEKLGGLNKGLIITAIVLLTIAISLVVFALINKINDAVYHNVYLDGVNLQGKTEEEVAAYLTELNKEFKQTTLVIKNGETEIIEITPENIGMAIDEKATRAKIMSFGRNDNIIVNNINVFKLYFSKQNLDIVYYYSESQLSNLVSEVTLEIEDRVIDDSFTVDSENNVLIITKGTTGKDIVAAEFKEDVLNAFKDRTQDTYYLKLEDAEPKQLDVDVVYAQVFKEAKDAYVDNTVKPAIYYKHEYGITFNKDELRVLLAKEENSKQGITIKFSLTTTKPEVTIQDITKDLYRDVLGEYVSSFSNSDANRASNVKLAAKMLNGTIVMPGETFSFNKVMGDCGLASRGFKSAAVFKNGKVVQEIGGGVCQISSTLYIAALYANMSIVSRSRHALPVGYVPPSLDATIYYPYTDFKFKNTRDYPVKIVAKTNSKKKLTISICGTKEEVEYEIVLTSKKTGAVASKVQEQKDSSLEVGKTKTIQSGTPGYTSVAYKIVKLNGKKISTTLLSEDRYGSTPTIIAVGTKQVDIYGE